MLVHENKIFFGIDPYNERTYTLYTERNIFQEPQVDGFFDIFLAAEDNWSGASEVSHISKVFKKNSTI